MSSDPAESENRVAVRANRGILSQRDRKYFHNVLGVESGSAHERMIRQDIRERLLNAIYDFRLLLEHLRDDDLERVVDELSTTEIWDEYPLSPVVGFLYHAVAQQPGVDFETIVREGTHIGADTSDHVVERLEFVLETIPVELEALLDDLETGDGITLPEFGYLLRSGVFPKPDESAKEVSFHMTFGEPIEGGSDVRIKFERRDE